MQPVGLIPRNRLRWIPQAHRFAHEVCYFLHDECLRVLVECEEKQATTVKFKFKSKKAAAEYHRRAETDGVLDAMRASGLHQQARRVILNQITMAMVSDCLHHIFEGLRCMEKRKFIVGMNLLRKPLKDNLVYLAWMLGDEDGFYSAFTAGDPRALDQKMVGNLRRDILAKAIEQTAVADVIEAERLIAILFDPDEPSGLEGYFQHAVHLITVKKERLRTAPENFNFIFKRNDSDDIYDVAYSWLPYILLFLSHVVLQLFNRIRRLDKGSMSAFMVRSKSAYLLTTPGPPTNFIAGEIARLFAKNRITCDACDRSAKITDFNAASVILCQRFRCTSCQRHQDFPISWMF